MAYVDMEYYKSLYGDITDAEFNRLSWEADRLMDLHTTGMDGVEKLQVAFPTNERDSEAVKRCACKLIDLLQQIETTIKAVTQGRGYEETANGLRGKVVSSISAGNESISYSASAESTATVIDKALADKVVQDRLIQSTVKEYLSGKTDANGVNLLYMGRYPCNL